ncbi:hypothetical protein BWI93_05390 [Siphonobacter sp. BAB-5385]|uniref:hypothetical protein n=1 Tax=Siphonobacter sp. BAB-5385 TaxID=1864822 RepID=UPI000B9E8090|nr:hypothetical protein [Siphonobacter sp. BAB-5385]OZI09181.1 hypothetical protein BWI93_05390 [Siphonobacter sp. BAB-5385]
MKIIDFSPFPEFPQRLPLQAAPLDDWAFELDKSVLGTLPLDQAEVVLYSTSYQANLCATGTEHVYPERGGLRLFEDDGMVSFRLAFGALTPGKQFAVLIDGTEYFGTYEVGSAGQEVELNRIVAWLEAKTDVQTKASRMGSLITVTMRPAFAGQFNGKEIATSLGSGSRQNVNNPTLYTESVGQPIDEPAMDGYRWTFTNLMEGQIVRFNNFADIVIRPGDTSQNIIPHLLTGIGYSVERDLFWVPKPNVWTLDPSPGSRKVVNTNKVQFTANYVSTSNGVDYYNFSVIADKIEEGNTFRYTLQNGTTFEVVAKKGWNVNQVMTALQPDGKTVGSRRGQTPAPKYVPGSRTQVNPSAPVVIQELVRTKKAQQYIMWRAVIGDDVMMGNRFELREAAYVAKPGDTAATVAAELAKLLGGKAEDTTVLFFSSEEKPFYNRVLKGSSLSEADRAPVSVAGSSVLVETKRKCVRGWVRFPCEKGLVHIGIRKKGEALPFALSNAIHVKSRYAGKTVFLQVGNWQMRLAGTVRNLTAAREDTTSTSTSGSRATTSKVSYKYDLMLAPYEDWYHIALTTLLKGSFFLEKQVYQVDGDYEQSAEMPSGYGRSGKQTLTLHQQGGKCFSSERAQLVIQPNPYQVRVRLAGEEKTLNLTATTAVSKGAYYLEVYSGSPFPCRIDVVQDGLKTSSQYLSGFGHTEAEVTLLMPGTVVEVKVEELPKARCEYVAMDVSVSSWACELRTVQQLSDYNTEDYSGEYADKGLDIQIPETGFGGTDAAMTGWKKPVKIKIGATEVDYSAYLEQYVSEGYPYLGPVYDPISCGS